MVRNSMVGAIAGRLQKGALSTTIVREGDRWKFGGTVERTDIEDAFFVLRKNDEYHIQFCTQAGNGYYQEFVVHSLDACLNLCDGFMKDFE